MIVENGKAVLKTPAGGLKLVDPADAERAASELGWVEATPDDLLRDDARKQGAGGMLATVGEEAIRTAGAAASILPGVDAGRAPVGLTELETGQTSNPLTDVFSDASLARREVNPGSAALGSQLGVLPAYLAGGIGGVIAGDLALGAAQEATDAEIERRGISGAHVLRNGALNLVFSGAAAGIPVAARGLLRGTDNLVQHTAARTAATLEEQGGKAVLKRASSTFDEAASAIDSAKAPRVANNPSTQRAALTEMAIAFQKSHPLESRRLADLAGASPQTRYAGLRELRAEATDELAAALDVKLARPELWGEKAVNFARDAETARALKPQPGAPLEAWQAYSDALRRMPDPKFAKMADRIDELSTARAAESWVGEGIRAAASKVAGGAGGAVAEELTETAFKSGGALIGAALTGGSPLGAIGGWLTGRALVKRYGERIADATAKKAAQVAAGESAAVGGKGLVEAADFIRQAAANERRLTARLLVDTRSAAKYVRLAESPLYPSDRFRGDHESLSQAFAASRATVEDFDRNPVALLDLLGEQFGDVDEQSPRLFREMTAKALETQRFLRSKLPPRRGVSVARPEGSPPSPLEMRQYALFHTAALDPESVWADARAGRLRREQVETLKVLHTDEYQDMRNMVIAELGNGRSTAATRQRLSLLFELGGSIEPALGPRARAIVEQARQQVPKRAEPSAPSLTRAEPRSKTSMTPGGMASAQLGMNMGA
jgi:hypothetical protein